MTDHVVSPQLHWKELYQLALIEIDPLKLPPAIAAAQRAVLDRIEETLSKPDPKEQEQLNAALRGLRVLQHEFRAWASKPDAA